MKSITLSSVFATAVLFFAGSSSAAGLQQEEYVACFSSSKPLEDQGSYQYQSNGYCLKVCYDLKKAVFGLHNEDHCLCGDLLPAKSSKESDDACDTPCAAWPIVNCGGADAYSVYLTGYSEDTVDYYSSGSSSSSSNSSSTTSSDDSSTTSTNNSHTTSTSNSAAETQSSVTDGDSDKKDGPDTAAIAAGVVIGVVGLAALIGAGFFLWRFKKRHPADNRLREMSNVEQFSKPVSQDSMSDARFDGDFGAQRRQSNGSIDDDRDFSRRILQVTNPDRL
ncbi:hypothetical protein BJX70DRAFT_110260 [Aspergillus crustosus]